MLTAAQENLTLVNTALINYKLAVDSREDVYSGLSSITTRILAAIKSSGSSELNVETAKSIIRKIQGRRLSPKKAKTKSDVPTTTDPVSKTDDNEPTQISASQTSYANLANNFDALLQLLPLIQEYKPNEGTLNPTDLRAYCNELKMKNFAVDTLKASLDTARLNRNYLMYNLHSGLVVVSLEVKNYVKAAFGASSPQFKQISGISFRSY
jgi:hypothetical protein